MLLKELAAMQKDGLAAYFKGGTALYKALKTTNRFSEDIDISVDTRGCSRTQNDKRLVRASKNFISLQRDSTQGKTNRSEVISVYTYVPVTVYDEKDMLQRFGKVKVEATSFTISEPIEELQVSTILYSQASEEQKNILKNIYDVTPFSIKTISLERIFIDKLFAAEAYTRKSALGRNAFDSAKHIYNLAILIDNPRITKLLSDAEQIKNLLDIRLKEENERLDGIPGILPSQFIFFKNVEADLMVREAYEIMQNQYVFRLTDRIDFNTTLSALETILSMLTKNKA